MSPAPGALTVGIDIGTTSVKVVAADAAGTVVARDRLPHPVRVPAPDRLEHDAEWVWRRAPVEALARLAPRLPAPPAAVAVAAMVPTLTAVDGDGRPVAPGLLYGDARGGRAPRPDEPGDGHEMIGFLRWLVEQTPGAAGYWPAQAVANHALAGAAAVDIATAFGAMPLYGPEGWDEATCRDCGADPAALPEVVMMGAPLGPLADDPGVTLAAGTIDAVSEQLVAGADAVGDVLVLCGTTLIAWVVADEPVSVPGLWTIPHTTEGLWLVGGPSNAGGLFLGWADALLAPGGAPAPGGDPGHRVAGGPDDPLAGLDPERIPVWAPYVRGERTPLHDPDRRAALHGLDLTHGPGAVRRAAWEASAFVVRRHLDLAGQAGLAARRIVASGGATRIGGLMQALADGTGLPVHVVAAPEGAALGAAYLARLALTGSSDLAGAAAWARTGRIVEPDPRWAEPTAERYARFLTLP
ncbi:MAG TPA: FGGY-family carbohydrate kinase [Acidimicrobiales bacterium]